MARLEGSGRTGEKFCRSKSLAPSTIWLWRRKLAGTDKMILPISA